MHNYKVTFNLALDIEAESVEEAKDQFIELLLESEFKDSSLYHVEDLGEIEEEEDNEVEYTSTPCPVSETDEFTHEIFGKHLSVWDIARKAVDILKKYHEIDEEAVYKKFYDMIRPYEDRWEREYDEDERRRYLLPNFIVNTLFYDEGFELNKLI